MKINGSTIINYCNFLFIFFASTLVSCSVKENDTKVSAPEKYSEAYRLQLHFSPPEKWMNDPNGMVYHNGEYHIFYQY